MPRRKAERVVVPRDGEISRKALKNSDFAFWGPEPTWDTNFSDETKEEWNELDKNGRTELFRRFAEFAHLEWFQLKAAERQAIVDYKIELAISKALGWYSAMTDEDQQKNYLIDYAKQKYPEKVSDLKKVDKRFFNTFGPLARIVQRGAKVPEKWLNKIKDRIDFLIKDSKTEATSVISATGFVQKKEVPDRDPVLSGYIGTVDGLLDDYGIYSDKSFPDPSMGDTLLKAGATNGQLTKVHEHYSKQILEYFQALNAVEEVAEYYEGVPKKQIQKVYDWLTGRPSSGLIDAVRSTKKRKKRAKKEKTADQILKRFSCKNSDSTLKMESIDPEDILGAQQLWVFNTKTRKLGVYYAKDDKGLGISRKSITNYDEEKSVCKKIRKPADIVPGVRTAGKVALRHFLDDIHAVENVMKSRINEDILLVRAVK